jgi:hypothetical protein
MHRIDDPTAVPTLPAPRPPGPPGYFTGGSPGTGGFLATRVRYEFMNAIQEELAAIVEDAGLILDKTNNNQVLQALRQMLRFKLMQDEYFYINPNGDDNNDGLTPSTPLKTGQAAWNKGMLVDLNGHNLILQFASGTYLDPLVLAGQPLGIGAQSGIVIQGNVVDPTQVIFAPTGNQSCVSATEGAAALVQGVTLLAHGVPDSYQNMGAGLIATTGGFLSLKSIIFEQCDWCHMMGIGGGVIETGGNPYQIAGGGEAHIIAAIGGYVANVNSAVSITGTPHFTQGFEVRMPAPRPDRAMPSTRVE